MDTALEYLAQRTRDLYRTAIDLQHLKLSGLQQLRQLERLRPEIFDVSRHLTDLFGEHASALGQARADKAEKLILALHRRLILGYSRLLRTRRCEGKTAALLMQRVARSAQEIYFSCLLNRHDAPPGLWSLLHRVHRHACRLQVQHLAVDDGEAFDTHNQSVADAYLHALLVAGSQPLDVPPDSLPALIESTRILTSVARVHQAQNASRWLLALAQDQPFRDTASAPADGYALELVEFPGLLNRLNQANGDTPGFDLNAHLLACWNPAEEQTWQVCCGLQALLAQLGAREEPGLDAGHFQRQSQQDIWSQHDSGRGGLDEQVPHHSAIEFAPAAAIVAASTVHRLTQVLPGIRHFSGVWGNGLPPSNGDWLGVRTASDMPWGLARAVSVETMASGALRLHGTWLASQPQLCRITLRGKTRESAAHHALLFDDASGQRVLCPSLPLEPGRKVAVEHPSGRFLALLGAAEADVFALTPLVMEPDLSPL
ncbi:hypothetical protein HNP46_000588 [Pseudomonas nitritireducens]|uniref:GTPase n=1 Tax=Pseudomonas nitroreducens TaxID=46680 RepID=A0A7W7KFZ1_PSENT|nr:hypothetical protein [Pseudomonas nitritireducens]MBB4861751.1 hypothetical protein [Pseudomonas nitritireducens]